MCVCVLKSREADSKSYEAWGTPSNQLLGAFQMMLCTQRQLTSFHLSFFILSELNKQGMGYFLLPKATHINTHATRSSREKKCEGDLARTDLPFR